MGFGNVASALILVIAAMTITTGVVVSFKDYYDKTTSSVALTQAKVTQELKTDIAIEIVSFDNTTNTTKIYVKNSGNEKLDIDKVDIYINKNYIPRNSTNRSIEILEDTNIIDDTLWDPKEQVLIQIFNYSLSTTQLHEVTVTTQYGVKDLEEFSV